MKQSYFVYYLIAFFCFAMADLAVAQSYITNIQHYSVEEGLSSRFINDGLQDDRGFIWLATDYGLNRFDGTKFRVFGTSEGLRAENCFDLHKDLNGNLWIYYNTGEVDVMDPVTETVIPLESLNEDLAGKYLMAVGYTRNKNAVLFRDSTHLMVYDGTFRQFQLPTSFTELPPLQQYLFASPWNTILLQVPDGLSEYDLEGTLIRQFPFLQRAITGSPLDDSTMVVTHLLPSGVAAPSILTPGAPPTRFHLTTNGIPGSYRLQKGFEFENIFFVQDQKNNIWAVNPKQFSIFDKAGKLIVQLNDDEAREVDYSFPKQLFIDSENNAWLLTYNGFYIVSFTRNPFRQYLQQKEHISVRGIENFDSMRLMAATYEGLYLINKCTGENEKVSTEIYYGLEKCKDGTFLTGRHAFRSTRLFFNNGVLEAKLIQQTAQFPGSSLRPFTDPYTGIHWYGSMNGLSYLDTVSNSLHFYKKYNDFKEFMNLETQYLHFRENEIMIATSNGIYLLDRNRGLTARFNHFPNNRISHIHEDDDGSFWLTTRGGGLLHWNRETSEIQQFDTRRGLSHNILYAVYDDRRGNLWLPSNYGVMRFEKSTGIIHNFLPEDGITHEEFNATSHFRDTDGTFYFGGLNGITAFHPDYVTVQQKNIPLVVTSFQLLESSGQLVDRTREFLSSPEVLLLPGAELFSIEFSLLDYSDSRHIYGWILEGLNKEWTYQDDNRLRFNTLPYGRYTLRIKAQGRGNSRPENELVIPVHVIRPFYLRKSFIFGMMGLLSLLTYLAFRLRLRKLRAEKRQLEAVVSQRTSELVAKNEELAALNDIKDRFFAIIAHDMRSPIITLGGLTRKITYLIRKNRIDDIQELGQTVDQAVSGVQTLLDNLLNWAMVQGGKFPYHPEQVCISTILENSASVYKHVAEAKNTSLQVSVAPGLTAYCDSDALSTIVRNLVDNAIKFSPENGEVHAKAFSENDHIVIQVSDNGDGIPADQREHIFQFRGQKGSTGTGGEQGTGLGLVLCHELVQMNKGKITVESKKGRGTVFSIQLPKEVPTSDS